jgi:signal transduction histidine kinase
MLKRVCLLSSLLALVALVPLTTFGLYIIQMVSDHLVQRTLGELERSVLIDADRMKRAFDMAHGDLTMLNQLTIRKLARARAVRDQAEVERWYEAIAQAYLTVSDSRKVYNQIRYLDENGLEVVRVDYDGTHPPRIIPWERLQEKQQRDYFAETMKLGPGQVYTSPPDLNRERDEIEVPHRLVIRYATPLFDDAGHRRGIVVINLMAGPLLDALHQEGKAARKEVYAVDQEGFYLLHSDPVKQWGGPRDLNTGERLQRDFPTLATQILSRHAVATVMGEHVITAQPLALSASSSGPFLVLVERMPTSIVLAAVADFRLHLLILLVGVGAVTAAGTVLVGDRLTRPIATLAEAAQQVQLGNLDVRIQAGGSHEIAALGEAFNAMTASLVQSRSQIERQLAELGILNRIGIAVSGTLSLNEVLDQALDAILLVLKVQTAEIFLVDEKQAEVVLAQHQGPGQEAFQEITRFKLGEGFPGWVALSGEPLITTDLARDARFLRKRVIELGFRTYAAIPLKAAGKVIGTLGIADHGPLTSTEANLPLLMTIGAAIGMAVANAYLYKDLSHATERLETKVEDLERMQSRLIEAERLQAAGQMAAGVAHDFNNALMGILGQTQLMRPFLEQGPAAATAEGYAGLLECLARQEQAVLDAAATVRKIRESTRQSDTEAFGPVALSGIIELLLAMSRPRWKDQAEAAGVQIAVRTTLADTPPVFGNAAELYEALTNLLFNALDAMPHGGTLTITTTHVWNAESEGQGWVEITVTDTGVGMSPTIQAHLFEPFFTTKGVRGTGLGLSMVHGIISRHAGEITVQSAEGQGTTMTLRLPVAEAIAETVPPPAAPSSISRPLTLLVIDDDPLLAETLSALLRILGHEVAIATSGEEGLTRLAAERFDLVLTDLGMPEMSGWEVAQAVKARWPKLPVILVTGWGDALEGEPLESRGVDAVLAKPYTVAQLQAALAQCSVGPG